MGRVEVYLRSHRFPYKSLLLNTIISNVLNYLYNHVVSIRLAGRNSHYHGRVEVYFNGEWGTVCDDGWDTVDATVVCRQLGFSSSSVGAYGSATYGQGTGPIWLSRLSCFGNESSLFECGQLSVATKNCTHSDDASVYCDRYNHGGRIRREFFEFYSPILEHKFCTF